MRTLCTATVLLVIIGLLLPERVGAEFTSLPAGFDDVEVVAGVDQPTAFDWLPSGELLITEKQGNLLRASTDGEQVTDLNLPIAVCAEGERGLLGVAVDPDFGDGSNYVYVYYTASQPAPCANRVSRFSLGPGDTIGPEEILIENIPSPATNHNAGDLQFDRNTLLFVSVGDGNNGGNARRFDVLNGKILRIDRDGNIPAGNPFTGEGSRVCGATGDGQGSAQRVEAEKKGKKQKRKARQRRRKRNQNQPPRNPLNACQEIFATGLRNPFRIAFDPDDNDGPQRFYINDVGEQTWEEIDSGTEGADYGWDAREGPCRTGQSSGCRRDRRFVNPVHAYRHTSGCRSITGGAFVPNDESLWPDAYDDSYIYADYVCGRLFALRRTAKGASVSELGSGETATHLAFGPDGALYYAAFDFGAPGAIHKIVYSSS